MIKLIDILKEALSSDIYRDEENVWTHVTNKKEVIDNIKKAKAFWGVNEKKEDFTYYIPLSGKEKLTAGKQNSSSPNFYKGKIYLGGEGIKYLITFKSPKPYPGDSKESNNWEEIDYPLIPNGNRANKISFNNSANIGILKPEFRDIKNFKFYEYDEENKVYKELKDI